MSKKKATVLIPPKEFAQMGADAIARFIRDNENTAIIGSVPGIDRHIIQYPDHRSWFDYLNPYIK